jgi:hypothetical protein
LSGFNLHKSFPECFPFRKYFLIQFTKKVCGNFALGDVFVPLIKNAYFQEQIFTPSGQAQRGP